MRIPESKMAAYMCEHGCCLFLVADELKEAYRGVLIHWRDLNGHWYAARLSTKINKADQDQEGLQGRSDAEGWFEVVIAGPSERF